MIANVPNYSHYHVTKGGDVYSNYSGTWEKKKLSFKSSGYLQVNLFNDKSVKKLWKVHRLVAIVHIPNPDNLPCVCHKDNIRSNNFYRNLYWGTHKTNQEQMYSEGRNLGIEYKNGFTYNKMYRALRMSQKGYSQTYIAKRLNSNQPNISRLLKRLSNKKYLKIINNKQQNKK